MRKLAVALLLALSARAERRIAVIVDTSGSMQQNDTPRYAVQISKILSDLVEDEDKLAIIRFPDVKGQDTLLGLIGMLHQDCNVPADPSLMITMNGSQRAMFKDRVDALLHYNGPTFFGAPLRDAIPFLGQNSAVQRLLLLVSDADEGFGSCNGPYTQMLEQIGGSGATVALIKMGAYADDGFANNPAIQFREDVQDSRKLISAVAQVYQRFLGSKKVQTGTVSGDITVEISPHVKEAFLVVAAENPMGQLSQRSGNPRAERVDLDYRSGGQTTGVDSRPRGYRVVRLTNPDGGRYTFLPPPGTRGGWMLIEDYALLLRLVSQAPVPTGTNSTVQLEVVDERNGQRVTDAPTLNNLHIDGRIESNIVTLNNSGGGLFTIDHKFGDPGDATIQLRMRGDAIDRTYNFTAHVAKIAGKLESQTPDQARVGSPSPLRVKLTGVTPPPHASAVIDGRRIELSQEHPGDGVYSGTWTPDSPGRKKIRFEADSSANAPPVEIDVEVTAPAATPAPTPTPTPPPPPPTLANPGDLDFGRATSVPLGRLVAGGTAQSEVRLINGRVARDLDIEISTDFDKKHVKLEIQTPSGWQTLSPAPMRAHLVGNDPLDWPLRVTAADCPEGCKASEPHMVSFRAHRTDGGEEKIDVPIQIEIIPDPWYICWRREIFAALAILAGAIIAHGFLSPYRFASRAGVQISPAEDMAEGFFYPLRAARGSGSGFYRDARLFLTDDFRVTSTRRGGLARLTAFKNGVRLKPENGRAILKQQADGTWEPISQNQETFARPGIVYRNEQRSIYFEIRTK